MPGIRFVFLTPESAKRRATKRWAYPRRVHMTGECSHMLQGLWFKLFWWMGKRGNCLLSNQRDVAKHTASFLNHICGQLGRCELIVATCTVTITTAAYTLHVRPRVRMPVYQIGVANLPVRVHEQSHTIGIEAALLHVHVANFHSVSS